VASDLLLFGGAKEELRGLEPLTPCLQNSRKLSDVVAHLGLRPRARPLEADFVGCCCGQDW
jgi:hypothetical protein